MAKPLDVVAVASLNEGFLAAEHWRKSSLANCFASATKLCGLPFKFLSVPQFLGSSPAAQPFAFWLWIMCLGASLKRCAHVQHRLECETFSINSCRHALNFTAATDPGAVSADASLPKGS